MQMVQTEIISKFHEAHQKVVRFQLHECIGNVPEVEYKKLQLQQDIRDLNISWTGRFNKNETIASLEIYYSLEMCRRDIKRHPLA